MKPKKPLPKYAVPVMIVAGGVVLLLVGWLLVVSPQKKKVADLKKQTESAQQQIAANVAAAATVRSATATPKIRVADVYKLAKAMPSLTDMPNILLELDQLAKASGVDLSSIGPGALIPVGGGYSKVPLTMTIAGDFYSVTDMLYRLRNLVSVRNGALEATGRIFTVDTVALSPAGKQLTASITLDTYVYGAAAGAGAAPVTALPTDTSTTSTDTTSAGPSAAGAP